MAQEPIGARITRFPLERPGLVTALMVGATLLLGVAAGLPSLWPQTFAPLHPARIDTDPENMLRDDEPHRVFHDRMKERFGLWDMIVVGVVRADHPDGAFTPGTLRRVEKLTRFAEGLRWPPPAEAEDPGARRGVVKAELIAPSTVDFIEQGERGEVRFSWLMPRSPDAPAEARQVREKARRIPFLDGTLVSEDGKALALYLPLTSKDVSYDVYRALEERIARFGAVPETYHITGLPVAEDTFGVEMFYQMAISAPLAMLVIFLLLAYFFRKLTLIVPPMIVAAVCSISAMSLLVITGNTIHIMSSMIPIFLMPIAVLDAIHIISDFFDCYPAHRDRRAAMREVMATLFAPMLFTTLTTAAGFASLALTPIPPVQVFGVFVAVGVVLAWLWTILFIPAAVAAIPERRFASLARPAASGSRGAEPGRLARALAAVGRGVHRRAAAVLGATVLVVAVALYGIGRIEINDNPTHWFVPDHPIRVADRVLNRHFGGTYMAYLRLAPPGTASAEPAPRPDAPDGGENPEPAGGSPAAPAGLEARGPDDADAGPALPAGLGGNAAAPAQRERPPEAAREPRAAPIFKRPEVLRYTERLAGHLRATTDRAGNPLVGKVNAVGDLIKTVHRELLSGAEKDFRIPDTSQAVAQCLLQFQNSHRPGDLWHFVTPDYGQANLWLQLKSGDNKDMERVVRAAERFMGDHPPPVELERDFFGLTYINVVWQDKMVSGMLQAFLGSFLVVLLMMILLFRSALWGILCMVPLTVSVGLIYGLVSLVGKDYDMPVAVLSALSLGLAVDYAIHFLARSRFAHELHGSWRAAVGPVFGEPARAITRNAVVVGVGFLPLLAAPLMPYKTVGLFIALILLTAGAATLLILPALIRVLEPWLFPATRGRALACRCGTCSVAAAAAVALAAVNLHQALEIGWTPLGWGALAAVIVLAVLCAASARRARCRVPDEWAPGPPREKEIP